MMIPNTDFQVEMLFKEALEVKSFNEKNKNSKANSDNTNTSLKFKT